MRDHAGMVHRSEIKVRFYELDPYNHVNHTNYLAYFETARIEFLSDLGFGLDVMKDRGFHLVVVELEAKFIAAAGLGDVLSVTTEVGEVAKVTSTWNQEMTRHGDPIARLKVKAAFTDTTGRPRRLPADFAEAAISGAAGS